MSRLWSRYACTSIAFLLLPAVALPAFAAPAQRTFVASYGNDLNPCSLAFPCRSFNVAIAVTTSGGEVIVLDSAGYGPALVTQSVSIIAPAGVYAGITAASNNPGVYVNASGIKVVLQNLAINGLTVGNYGVIIQQGAELDINNCTIANFAGAGIYSLAAAAKLHVRDTLIRDNSGAGANGVWLSATTQAVFERVGVVNNAGDGLRVDAGASASVKRSVFSNNGGSGVIVRTTGAVVSTATIEDSLIAGNGSDGITSSSGVAGAVAEVTASRNTITRNVDYGVGVTGTAPGTSVVTLNDNLISQQGLDGVFSVGSGAVVTANNNTFSGNGNSAMNAAAGSTIHTVKGADGLPNNAGEQTTPTIGNVIPSNPF